MNIIILNGPPRSGKDTVARILREQGYNFLHVKFADRLRAAACGLLNVKPLEFEAAKAQDPRIRKTMITMSEEVVKPLFGDAFFAEVAAQRVQQSQARRVLVSDGGFQSEVDHFISSLAQDGFPVTYQVWNLHRRGCSFGDDSREYVYPDPRHGSAAAIYNLAGIEELKVQAVRQVKTIWGDPF
jgi:hypothetical protein